MIVATHRLQPNIADALTTLARWVCQEKIEAGDTTVNLELPLWIKVAKVGTAMEITCEPPPSVVVNGLPDPLLERINIWPESNKVGEIVAKGRLLKGRFVVELVK